MYQTIINMANLVSPFIISAFVLYVCVGWILVYFKRITLARKYFYENFEYRFFMSVFMIIGVFVLVIDNFMASPKDDLTIAGFTVISCLGWLSLYVIISKIYKALINFRDNITPQ